MHLEEHTCKQTCDASSPPVSQYYIKIDLPNFCDDRCKKGAFLSTELNSLEAKLVGMCGWGRKEKWDFLSWIPVQLAHNSQNQI